MPENSIKLLENAGINYARKDGDVKLSGYLVFYEDNDIIQDGEACSWELYAFNTENETINAGLVGGQVFHPFTPDVITRDNVEYVESSDWNLHDYPH